MTHKSRNQPETKQSCNAFPNNSSNNPSSISLSVAKTELNAIIKEINLLESLLNSNSESLDSNTINAIKQNINSQLMKYETGSVCQNLINKIKKRKKKRQRIKRSKQNIKKKRQDLEKLIDSRLSKKKEMYEKMQKAKRLTETTERRLSGLNGKINDAKRHIKLLDSLVELRRVRKIQAQKDDRGETDYERKIQTLKDFWINALKQYENDERELLNKLMSENLSTEDQWLEALFGESRNHKNSVLKTNQTLKDFIEIRCAWDSCIVPNNFPYGSQIPTGWVIPNANPSPQWAVYQV